MNRYYKLTDAEAIREWKAFEKKQKEAFVTILTEAGLSGDPEEMFIHVSNSAWCPSADVYSKVELPKFMTPKTRLNGQQFILHIPKKNYKEGKLLAKTLRDLEIRNIHTFMQEKFSLREDHFEDNHIYSAVFGYSGDTLLLLAHKGIEVPENWTEITYGELKALQNGGEK